jgi:hypothetical protein
VSQFLCLDRYLSVLQEGGVDTAWMLPALRILIKDSYFVTDAADKTVPRGASSEGLVRVCVRGGGGRGIRRRARASKGRCCYSLLSHRLCV